MNRYFVFSAALVTCFYLGACERHSFEDTKVLYEKHGEHAGEKHGEHAGEKHGEHAGEKHGEDADEKHGEHADKGDGNHAKGDASHDDQKTESGGENEAAEKH